MRPPSFDSEFKEEEKAWILNMGTYFYIYNYLKNLRARQDVYPLNGKDSSGKRPKQ